MKILFICTHNRCRSILSEAVTNQFGKGKITAKSAGSAPTGQVHPLSLKYLKANSITTQGLCSESWDVYESWKPDVVITVCDSAANEVCPLWFKENLQVHWGLKDPSSMDGSEQIIKDAFNHTIDTLKLRIAHLATTNLEALSDKELIQLLEDASKIYA